MRTAPVWLLLVAGADLGGAVVFGLALAEACRPFGLLLVASRHSGAQVLFIVAAWRHLVALGPDCLQLQ